MQAFISIFNLSLFLLSALIFSGSAHAQSISTPEQDDDIVSSPYSGYGEFNNDEDEAQDEHFFQYGRFFGVGLGIGATSPTGNAGRIYQGGFPTLDFRLICWLDFNFALALGIQNSKHSYDIQPDGATSVNLFRLIPQIRYYFDTHNLSAPISFVGPYLIAGAGIYRRTDNIGAGSASTTTAGVVQEEQGMGFNLGAGLELTLKPKKTFLNIEGMAHFVNFNDQFDSKFNTTAGIPDKSGSWFSISAILLFTW